ncbi:MAG: DUF1622 domain-containing protein [Ignavibacteria bacterium]|nr:DUF1622 domain-containing protein [Ignavibacteria bacterium]
MFEEFFVSFVENVARGIELVAVILIGLVFIYALFGSVVNITKRDITVYQKYKIMIAKVLQTGLEFLVAADIIRTVIVKPTLEATLILALLIIIRTFLSWTLTLETEGRWPWQKSAGATE